MPASPKIHVSYWAKPIPLRQFDWSAVYDDYDEGGPIGEGRTEADAVLDLIENHPRGVQCTRDVAAEIDKLMLAKPEAGEQWAQICLLSAHLNGGPFYGAAS